MPRSLRATIGLFHAAGLRFSADGCAFFAQALAFNALFAVFPLTILAIAVLAFVYGDVQSQERVFALILQFAPELQDVMTDNLRNVLTFRGVSGAVSLVGLVWSGKNLFQGLSYALDRALGVPHRRPLLPDILIALVMLPVMGLLLLIATAVPLALSLVAHFGFLGSLSGLPQIETYAFSLVLVFVVAALLYRYLPNRALRWTHVVRGAAFTAIAFNLAQIAFAVYTTHVNFTHVYGAVAALAVALLWFYYVATIFLFGAEIAVADEAARSTPAPDPAWNPAPRVG